MSEWAKDEIVMVMNQDSRQSLARAKTLQKLAKTHRLRTVACSGGDMGYVLRQELKNKKLERLIVAGGDGSVALAASLLVKQRKSVELAVVPVGTANYYSKTLGIKTLAQAFSVAVGNTVEDRHVCEANGRIFMIGAGMGVSSRMFDQISDNDKRKFGKLAYLWGVIRLFFVFDPMKVTIKANGEQNTYATTEVQVINQSIGERFHLQPAVDSREPYFEIVTYGIKHTRLSPIFALVMLILSFGRNQKYLKRIRTTEAKISVNRSEVVSLDGDSLEQSPIVVKLVKKPLQFAVAKK